ncbi:1-deoxy-D-xylulose-5-phosphate synthase [Parabacteroides sp. PF5-5]|uniref:1-deoxy-D-xylulose-5-phosphate synthase n=1 Tax=unclassified Parabacteroides TaxID=2649774 RepID=UPI002475B381|nr:MULTISPECIES: 1-deoxy-D-xylulose-5-phosphate synthase [unclassified Parabacteroides]MDH6306639.1 1-deoxy-D-xylulose-5-phosphate synthase [Parabacteroides sp. PH5-39]MDH6317606.1 1-deoxy-D-xylulose-5-phosphate synthase [Parabacteroides sp. PF5-13]MDH6321350.1 1-deoxy-D-xylulose-5-phosphate synthase [Parabacteroides sp. PH5-13]MDH6325085.1 1-deoxy-D-xylulose-5-phosphate synthase [Parabacteroides sp. PH5-8]MDH6328794.1 1-deoxy-D-xylulose-5-phosphate synthase [Parabacteroides sp. PH5-41]
MAEEQNIKILQSINSPHDLRLLPIDQLPQICSELRQYIIDVLSENPGHLGASLGTVELTVALHWVFNTPFDRIVWDVGHQAYGHKILTGRRDTFHTLRKFGGISGFPKPEESEYDSFVAGHASNSISAALGMSVVSALRKEDRQVVAVIGDGAMTGGLAFEGLNNAAINPNNLLIILNDNNMAIDDNVGAMSQYLVDITTSQTYNKMRYDVYRGLKKMKLITEGNRGNILRFNNSLKALLTQQHNLFEGFSIRYFGPIDGHDLPYLIKVMNDIKHLQGPKLLHIKTQKGKGFKPAEDSATEWHAPGRFNKNTGERLIAKNLDQPQLYQDVFGHTLVELAKKDERVMGVTPAMPSGCSMTYMMKEFPKRTFDVGIAEGHAVTYSAGLAKEGAIPFCNIYSSFMQRAYDNMIHDVALQKLHMVVCLDRGGLVGEDGATHHGVFDMAYLRPIPDIAIASPLNEWDLRNLMFTGYKGVGCPLVIRYPRGQGEKKDWRNEMEILPVGKGRKLRDGNDIAVLSIGSIGNEAIRAIDSLGDSYSVAHYDMIYLKPIDEALLHEVGKNFSRIITIENGVIKGGLGSAVLEFMADNEYTPRVKRIGVPDTFIEHGSIPELFKLCRMDAESIAETIKEVMI